VDDAGAPPRLWGHGHLRAPGSNPTQNIRNTRTDRPTSASPRDVSPKVHALKAHAIDPAECEVGGSGDVLRGGRHTEYAAAGCHERAVPCRCARLEHHHALDRLGLVDARDRETGSVLAGIATRCQDNAEPG